MEDIKPNKSLCQYEIGYDEDILTVNILCKGCYRKELKYRDCFSSLLRASTNEINVEKVVISNHIKIQCFDNSLSILKKITTLSYKIWQLSLRTPTTSSGKIPKLCPGCQFHPYKIFSEFNDQFLCDINLFCQKLRDKTTQIYDLYPSNLICNECRIVTLEDFDSIHNQVENILVEIVNENFEKME